MLEEKLKDMSALLFLMATFKDFSQIVGNTVIKYISN